MSSERFWLAIGASAGLAAAAASLVEIRTREDLLPPGIAARVDGQPIRVADFERAVAALASDRRAPLTESDRRFVLDRMIDEELLVQHALALGLARSDRRVRSDLVSAVMGSLVASTDGYEPSDEEIERFYAEHAARFAAPGRARVRQVFVACEPRRSERDAAQRAAEALHRLRVGESFERVAGELGDPVIAEIPNTPLPESELAKYLGPSAARVAFELEAGATSEPYRSAQGFHVLQSLARDAARTPPLAEAAALVRAELVRERGDRAVREQLETLRAAAEIRIAELSP
jgi:peptidylprolyl isomerase